MWTKPSPLACRLLCGLLASGISQAEVGGVIRQCAAAADKDARIACLEEALRRAEDSDDSGDALPAAEAIPAAPESGPAPRQANAQPERQAVSPSSAPAGAVPSVQRGAADGPADNLGAEQVADRDRRDDEDDRIMATVVAFDFVRYQRLRVQLDNGQVWRQVDGDRVNVTRDLDTGSRFDVELWKTGLGGYRMRIVPVDRTLRVQRLK